MMFVKIWRQMAPNYKWQLFIAKVVFCIINKQKVPKRKSKTGYLRKNKALFVNTYACMRSNMTCLLARMSLLGEEASRAMERRQYQGMQEKMRREMQANWLGRIRHHGVAHRGAIFLT